MNNLKEICNRIKDLREFSDYTLKEFAEKLNISEEEYRDYEEGVKEWSISLLYNIASALMVDPGVILLGRTPEKKVAEVIYKGKGEVIKRYEGYSFISLNNDFIDSRFEAMLVTIKENAKPELVHHKGQEFNYILKGAMRVLVGEREYYLRAGDSIYFDATTPHAQISMEKTTVFLTVIEK